MASLKELNPALFNALSWIKLGVPVFPLVDKEPIGKWKDEATLDPEKASNWFNRYPTALPGLHLGPANLVVVDLDDHENDEMISFYPTWSQRSGSGRGTHHFYRGHCRSKNGFRPHIDIKSEGGYVVAYGTAPESLDAFGPVPGWIESSLASTSEPSQATPPLVDVLDSTHELRAAYNYVVSLSNGRDARIPVGERNSRTVAIAAKLRAMAVTREAAFSIIKEVLFDGGHYDGDDWTLEDVWNYVCNGYLYGQNPVGSEIRPNIMDDPHIREVALKYAETEIEKKYKYPVLTHAEMKTMPKPEWLLQSVIEAKGLNMIIAQKSHLKSYWMVANGCCQATGLPFMGKPTKQGLVVHVTYVGDGLNGIQSRKEAWEKYHGVQAENFRLVKGPRLRDPAEVSYWMDEMWDQLGHEAVLFDFDTVFQLTAGLKLIDHGPSIGEFGEKMIERFDAAVLFAHHVSKTTKNIEEMYGYGGASVDAGIANIHGLVNDNGLLSFKTLNLKHGKIPFEPYHFRTEAVGDDIVLVPISVRAYQEELDLDRLITRETVWAVIATLGRGQAITTDVLVNIFADGNMSRCQKIADKLKVGRRKDGPLYGFYKDDLWQHPEA